MTTAQWLNKYVAELQAAGRTVVNSREVYVAGLQAGYGRDALREWAHRHPDITMVAASGRRWSIAPARGGDAP